MASNHDADVPFGIEASQGKRKIIIQRHKLHLKFKMAAVGHIGKRGSKYFRRRNYYDTRFLAKLRSLISHLISFSLFECAFIMKLTHRVEMFVVNETIL